MARMAVSIPVDGQPEETSATARLNPTPEALARAVRQRRAALRMSQTDVRAESGLSVTTISKIERGEHHALQRGTMRRLDVALRWPVGTAESWYFGRGGLIEAPAVAPDMTQWVSELVPLLRDQLLADGRRVIVADGLPVAVVEALERLVAVLRITAGPH